MLHSIASKICRTDKPNFVLTYLKGRRNLDGTIYDYGTLVDSYGVALLPYTFYNIVSNENIFGFSGGGLWWSQSSQYCYNATVSAGGLFLPFPVTPSTSYNFTFMCRFFINAFPSVESRYNNEGSSLMFNGDLLGTGFGIFLFENVPDLLFVTSSQSFSITPTINLYTWYSLVLTIENFNLTNSIYTTYLNGTKTILGTVPEVFIDDQTSFFGLMGLVDINENISLPFNGYMTDILVSYDVVSENICKSYSLGGSIL
jgi:hypothetical protein